MIFNLKKNFLSLIVIFALIYLSSELRNLRSTELDVSQEENKIKPPIFSKKSGFYPENFNLELSSEEYTKIYYTVDSTDPRNSTSTIEYKEPILIYDKTQEPNIYSSKKGITFYKYENPNYPVDKAMIVRAVVKNANDEFSEIISQTYFITTDDLYKYQDLTVISIVSNPENFFDQRFGIYATGKEFGKTSKNANFKMEGREWERETFVTIFDKGNIILEQKLGIRIKGTATRKMPGKSFNLYARKEYGKSRIELDLLKENYDINGNLITSYKSIGLRNIYEESRFREKLGRDLFYTRKNLTQTNMACSIVFLDGEYWGLFLIQEKINDDLIVYKYLIPKKNVVIAKNNFIEDGPQEQFTEFQQFCKNYTLKNLTEENIYQEINNKVDLSSLMELFATNIYILNMDWPGRNDGEWKNFLEYIEGNEFSDGRWRFVIFDLDYTMGATQNILGESSPSVNNFKSIIENNSKRKQSYANLFYWMLKNNTEFRNKFINLYCDYGNDIFNIEKVKKLVEQYREEYTEIIAYSLLRWSEKNHETKLEGYAYYKLNYSKALDSIEDFFEQRPKFTFQHLKEFLNIKGDIVELTIEVKGKGVIKINTITPEFKNGIWKGNYFSNVPINVEAIPEEGSEFKIWNGLNESSNINIEIILSKSDTLIAIFE